MQEGSAETIRLLANRGKEKERARTQWEISFWFFISCQIVDLIEPSIRLMVGPTLFAIPY